MKNVEIICTDCGKDALLRREPIYEGFSKIGEELSCTACGHVFENEAAAPFKQKEECAQVFSDNDKSQSVDIFTANENKYLCRYCADYVMNPFMQFCALHKKEVQATDSCDRFTEKREKDLPL